MNTNRFSSFFIETQENPIENITGEWLKLLDNDTINDFIETFRKIDKTTPVKNEENWSEFIDLMRLVQLLYAWERNRDIEPFDPHGELGAEYFFRLASLIQFEYNHRNNLESKHRVLERDNEKYCGRLAIYD